MHLIKPSAIGHLDERGKRHAIYSLDFQPGGPRLATGASDSCVKIWNTDAFLGNNAASTGGTDADMQALGDDVGHASGSGESKSNASASASAAAAAAAADGSSNPAMLLVTLSSHTKSVNCVRWNADGSLLASGSDDCYILIYKLLAGPGNAVAFGSSGSSGDGRSSKNIENWSRCAILHGHSMDVLDIDWSPHGLLASASIDNTICIWDTRNVGVAGGAVMHTAMHVLRGHESYVKGVSFDPMGKYLVSCGSDNLLCVWDADSWELSARLDGPMKGSADRACSLFRRLSWAPDGQSFSATACCKSGRPVGMIIKRGTWEAAIDLVGHQQPSLSTRFGPHLLCPPAPAAAAGSASSPNANAGGVPQCTVAMGDALGVVSLWTSSSSKAVLVLTDVFEGKNKAATDISWCKWGKIDAFAVASMDGTVVVVDVRGQFGTPLAPEALDKHYKKYYGRSFEQALHYHTDAQLLADAAPLQFMSRETRKGSALPGVGTGAGAGAGASSPPPTPARHVPVPGAGSLPTAAPPPTTTSSSSGSSGMAGQDVLMTQTTSTSKGGRKRITPVLMQSPAGDVSSLPASASASASSPAPVPQSQNAGSSSSGGSMPVSSVPVLTSNANNSHSYKRARLDGAFAPSRGNGSGAAGALLTHTVSYKTHEEVAIAPLAPDVHKGPLCVEVKGTTPTPTPYRPATAAPAGAGAGAAAGGLLVGIQRLVRPALLTSALKASGAVGSCSLSGVFVRRMAEEGHLWSCGVAGDVTCVAAFALQAEAEAEAEASGACTDAVPEGVVVAGCADGTLHLLHLSTGVRRAAPLVLGMSVTHVDVAKHSPSTGTNAHIYTNTGAEAEAGAGVGKVSILAMTADGELWVWALGGNLTCMYRACVRPLVISMRTRFSLNGAATAPAHSSATASAAGGDNTASSSSSSGSSSATGAAGSSSSSNGGVGAVTVLVERCHLDDRGGVTVHCSAKGSAGGEWQAFNYDPVAQTWIRTTDLRHLLSKSFNANVTATATAAGAGEGSAVQKPLAVLQASALKRAGLGPREIIPLAQAVHAAAGAGAGLGGSNGTGPGAQTKAMEVLAWLQLSTFAHLEDRICSSWAVGSSAEAEGWVQEWAAFCTRSGEESKVLWVVQRLLNCADRNTPASASANVADAGCGGPSVRACWGWLDSHPQPLRLVREAILPGIARSGGGGSGSSDLLSKVSEAAELAQSVR